jgi:hemolysin III
MKLSKLQTNGEEIANAISHGVMVFFGIAILTVMLIHCNGDGYRIAGAIIYGTATILLYTFSCLYHAITNHFAKTVVLKRFDHISIYLLIGGTYAPILLCFPYFQDTASFIPGLSLGVLILIIE